MEKRSDKTPVRIVVTGPESTGKTNISDYLANHFNAVWIPEYARYYVSSLQGKYDYSDIVKIARKQIDDYYRYSAGESNIIFFDTWLVITRIWFEEVYKKYPDWLNEAIETLKIDLYLLCSPDIPWKPDPLRENGGQMRNYLFERYKNEIKKLKVPCYIIDGKGDERYQNALKAVESFLNERKASKL